MSLIMLLLGILTSRLPLRPPTTCPQTVTLMPKAEKDPKANNLINIAPLNHAEQGLKGLKSAEERTTRRQSAGSFINAEESARGGEGGAAFVIIIFFLCVI